MQGDTPCAVERISISPRGNLLSRFGEFHLTGGKIVESVSTAREMTWVGVRVPSELMNAARTRTGMSSNTTLVRYALAVVAELDDPERYGRHLPSTPGPRRKRKTAGLTEVHPAPLTSGQTT